MTRLIASVALIALLALEGIASSMTTSYFYVQGGTSGVRPPIAQQLCRSVNKEAGLAVIRNVGQNTAAQAVMQGNGAQEAWLGLRQVNGTFRWVDGTSLTYSNWTAGEPSLSQTEDSCAVMNANGSWRSLACSRTALGALCVLPPGITLAPTQSPTSSPSVMIIPGEATSSPTIRTTRPTRTPSTISPTAIATPAPTQSPVTRPNRLVLFIQADHSRSIQTAAKRCLDDTNGKYTCWQLIAQFIRNLVAQMVTELGGYQNLRLYLSAFSCFNGKPTDNIVTLPFVTNAGNVEQIDKAITRLSEMNWKESFGTCPSVGAGRIVNIMPMVQADWPVAYYIVSDGQIESADQKLYSQAVEEIKEKMIEYSDPIRICGGTVGKQYASELQRLLGTDCILPAAGFVEVSTQPFARKVAYGLLAKNVSMDPDDTSTTESPLAATLSPQRSSSRPTAAPTSIVTPHPSSAPSAIGKTQSPTSMESTATPSISAGWTANQVSPSVDTWISIKTLAPIVVSATLILIGVLLFVMHRRQRRRNGDKPALGTTTQHGDVIVVHSTGIALDERALPVVMGMVDDSDVDIESSIIVDSPRKPRTPT